MPVTHDYNDDGGAAGFAEHRRAWREPILASGVLTAVGGAAGAAGQRVVRVVNLSEGGVGIVTATQLGVGTEHEIQIAGRPEGSGRVRIVFCRPARAGFEVGAQYLKG
jgi:hypothetical protein